MTIHIASMSNVGNVPPAKVPVFCCGFECGLTGVHWTVTGASFSTTSPLAGTRCLLCNPSGAVHTAVSVDNFGTDLLVMRFRVNWATLNNAVVFLGGWNKAGGSAGAWFNSADNKVYAGTAAGALGATGVSVATGTTYFIDVRVNTSANPWLIDVKVNGSAAGQRSSAIAASNVASPIHVGFGVTNSTGNAKFDDVVISTTAIDYPFGNGYVNHFIPTADGTHNVAGTGDFRRTLTATDILNSTTNAYLLIDEIPFEATVTDFINMLAPVNATDYVECVFGPAPGISAPTNPPRAVEVVCGINQSGTGNGNMELRLNDNGTTGIIYTATNVAGVAVATGQVFKRAHFADPPSAASVWVIGGGGNGDFTDLRIQFGSPAALDVNPDQYLGCAMIEAEFAAA